MNRNSHFLLISITLSNPKWKYTVKIDSSKYGAGCILEQENPDNKERHVVEHASCKYDKHQQNYPAIELEAYGLMFAINKWTNYLTCKPFTVETDSKAVEWIKEK